MIPVKRKMQETHYEFNNTAREKLFNICLELEVRLHKQI